MSNQRVTQLPSLTATQVNPADLFIIIDRDDYSSSTGDSKNINAEELSSYVASQITPGNTAEGNVFQPTHSFQVGSVLRMDSASELYTTASANSTTGLEAEVIGIVSNVIDQDNFVLTTDGVVSFVSPPFWLSVPVTGSAALQVGVTYFLADGGSLSNEDPSATVYPSWISKPYLVGVSPLTAVITNYRGFFRPGSDDFSTSTLYVTQSNTFFVGDAVRKTLTSETASIGNWTLASADSYQNSEVAGIVSAASANYFSLSLTGRITYLNNLEVGETYYLSPSASINFNSTGSLRNLVSYDETTCTQFSKPVFVAISSTDAIILNQRSYPEQQNEYNSTNSPTTYGPFAFPSVTQPSTGSVVTLLSTILPNADADSSALVYWIQPMSNTFVTSSLNIVNFNSIKTEGGWVVITQ